MSNMTFPSSLFPFKFFTVVLCAVLAAACSVGNDSEFVGGDGSTRPPPPVPNPAISSVEYSIKQLKLKWAPVIGATAYRLYESPDGPDGEDSGYSQIGSDFGADAFGYDHEIFLPGRAHAAYLLESRDAAGEWTSSSPRFVGWDIRPAPDGPNEISLTPAIGYFKATNTGEADRFGDAVALSADGRTLAVGATGEASAATVACAPADSACQEAQASNTETNAGAVYIYTRTEQGWAPQAYVKAPNAGRRDRFGSTVALSGDGTVLAVAAPFEESAAAGVCVPDEPACQERMADNSLSSTGSGNPRGAGAVYVYARGEQGWTPQAYVKASNTDRNDDFGTALVLSQDGNTLMVGAPSSKLRFVDENEEEGTLETGAVHIYTRDETGWVTRPPIFGPLVSRFGYALALNAGMNRLAVGAPMTSTGGVIHGAVYVYDMPDPETGWTLHSSISGAGIRSGNGCMNLNGAGSCFGQSVALADDGRTLAVGASTEASDASGIDGDENNARAPGSGAVYVFSRPEDAWERTAYIKATQTIPSNRNVRLGAAVALSGDGTILAAGASEDGTKTVGIEGPAPSEFDDDPTSPFSGAAYVFARGMTGWRQSAFVKASGIRAGDRLGLSVAIAADGSTLALGAPLEDGATTGIGGNPAAEETITDSGAVYLY